MRLMTYTCCVNIRYTPEPGMREEIEALSIKKSKQMEYWLDGYISWQASRDIHRGTMPLNYRSMRY